jgi:leucyl/phenylalanyl-tRNA--protein transferase
MNFPDPATDPLPEWHLVDGYYYFTGDIVSLGQPLTVENLLEAYGKGIFPWYVEGLPLPWYCPEKRAILEFDELHIPRSLKKAQRRSEFSFTIDSDFAAVIKRCSAARRPGQAGTWITKEFINAYCLLHDAGAAHSVEAWDRQGNLVGGLYGVDAGGVFCGESMFYAKPNASKLALLFLIDYLRSRGATWIDAQVMTPHLERLGAREIPRSAFLEKLRKAKAAGLQLFDRKETIYAGRERKL